MAIHSPVKVNTSAYDVRWPSFSHQRVGPFKDSSNDLWIFGLDGSGNAVAWKSTDNGATWIDDGSHKFTSGSSYGPNVLSVEFDSTNQIFYVLVQNSSHVLVILKFTISTTTWAQWSTGTGPTCTAGQSYTNYGAILCRKSDGSCTVVYQGQSGSMTLVDTVYYNPVSSAGAWGTSVAVSSTSAAYAIMEAIVGTSNRIHIFYTAENNLGNPQAVIHRSLSGTTLDTAAQVGTATVVSSDFFWNVWYDSGSGLLWLVNGNVMYRCTSGASPTWTTFSTSPSFGVSPNTPSTPQRDIVFYDNPNSKLWVWWINNSKFYYNNTTGTTWGSPTMWQDLSASESFPGHMNVNSLGSSTVGIARYDGNTGDYYFQFFSLIPETFTEAATVASVTSVSADETYTQAGGQIYTESATISSKTTVTGDEIYYRPPYLPLPYVGYVHLENIFSYIRSDLSYNLGPHEDANGNWWFITLTDGATGYVYRAYKSSDKGVTWDSGTDSSTTDHSIYGTICAHLDKANGKLYVLGGGDYTGTSPYFRDLRIEVFDVNTHTWSTFSNGTAPVETYYGGQYPPLILRQLSDNTLVALYSGPNNVGSMSEEGTSCYVVKLNGSGVWGTPIQVDPGTATVDYRPQDAIVGASDRLHIIYTQDTNPGVPGTYMYAYHRSLSGTTLDTASQIAGPFAANNGLGPGFALGYVGGTHTEVLLCMSDSLMRATSGANPTFTTDSVAFVGTGGGQVTPASRRVCYWYDSVADKLHIAYYGSWGAGVYGLGTRFKFWRAVYDYGTGLWNNGNGTPTLVFPNYAEAIDNSSTTYPIYGSGGDHEAAAQTFKLPEARTIKGLSIYSTNYGDFPYAYDGIYMELRADAPDGTLLKSTSAKFTSYAFGTSFFFPFDSPYTLAANTVYAITVKRGWGYYTLRAHTIYGTSADYYRDGSAWISDNGVWTAQPNSDLNFGIPALPSQIGSHWVEPTIDGFGFVWNDSSGPLLATEYRFGAATFIDVAEIASVTSVSAVERGPFTEIAEVASATTLTTDDTYGRTEVAEVASVTSIQSDDQYHLGTTLDEATVASATSLSSTEVYGNAVVYTDLATVESDTQVSFDEARTFGYVDATTVDSRTQVTSEDIYTTPITYTDAATVASTTSVSAIETYALPAAAIASFSWRSLGGGKVQFYDTSKGVVTSWYWDFGDGTFSTEQNPIHTYATGGTYTVTLTINGDITLTATHTVRAHYSHTPQDTLIDGQIAIGTDGSFHWSVGGVWYTAQWAPSIVNAVPQDCVLGQVAIGLDDSFHWYDGTEWHSFAEAEA